MRHAALVAALTVGGAGIGGALAAFTATTSNGVNSFSSAAEYDGPVIADGATYSGSDPVGGAASVRRAPVARAAALPLVGSLLNVIRQGADFRFYANVTDASGVASVTADTGTFLLGQTTLTSTGGPWTVGGKSYNYRSPLLTALTGLLTGTTQTWAVTARDIYGNTTGPQAFNVTIQSYRSVVTGTTGLAGYWRLGDSNSTMVNEVGSNGSYNGFWFGITWTVYATLGVTGALAGDTNTAIATDGSSGQYATTANRPIQDDFSIEFWLRATAAGSGSGTEWFNYNGLVDADDNSFLTNNQDFGTSFGPNGVIRAGVGPSNVTIASGPGYNDGAWHHVVFTRTRSTGALALYVDGAQVATGTGGTQSLNKPSDIRFGGLRTGGRFFNGRRDEVAVYTTVLDPTTILDHYNVGAGAG
jgi:hypothetical protein